MNRSPQERPPVLRPGWVMVLISLPIFIGALDLTVISAVLPQVILDLEIPLRTGLDDAAWMVTGYLLAYSISMTFMGKLSDLYGRRKVFLLALSFFALGSYLVAVAQTWPVQLYLRTYYLFGSGRLDLSYSTLYTLIAARMVQALGAGAMVPVGMAIAGDIYPAHKRASALGLIAGVDTLGWVVGHLYGGVIVRFWSWQTIFWLNLPLCLAIFLLIWISLRHLPQARQSGGMDWAGILLIAATLTLLNLGIGSGSDLNTQASLQAGQGGAYRSAWLLALAAVLLLLFLLQQRRAKSPLLDLSLFRAPNYLLACLLNLLVGGCLFIAIASVPLFINSLVAKTAEEGAWVSGWMLCALTVPMALATVPGGKLCERFGYRGPVALGLLVAAGGFLLMRSWLAATPYPTMAVHLLVAGIGIGLTMAPISTAILNASPAAELGTSSGLVILFRLIGMMAGVTGITNYGLQRAQTLSEQLILATPDLAGTFQAGIQVMERVIHEMFTIAAFIASLALVGALVLKNDKHVPHRRQIMNSNQNWDEFYKQEEPPKPAAAAPQPNKRKRMGWIVLGCFLALSASLVVCLAGAGLYWFYRTGDPIAKVVPGDTQVYGEINLLQANSKNVDRILSAFEDVSGEDQGQTLNDLLDEALSDYDLTFAQDVQPWMGAHASFAVRNIQLDSEDADFMLVLESRDRTKTDRFVGDLVRAVEKQDNVKFDERDRNGVTLYINDSEYEPMVIARSGKYFYLSNSEDLVSDSITTSAGDSLASTDPYKSALAALPADRLVTVYFGGEDLQKLLTPAMEDMLYGSSVTTGDMADNLLGMAAGVSAKDAGLRLDFAVAYDETRLNSYEREALATTYSDPTFDQFIPADTFFFLAFNGSRDLGAVFDMDNPAYQDVNESLQLLEQQSDLSVTDLLDVLGSEMGVAVGPADDGFMADSGLPNLGASLLASTNDEQKLERWLENALQAASANMGQEIPSREITLVSQPWHEVSLPGGYSGEMAPALYYQVADGRLILSSSQDNIKTIFQDKKTLAGDETYRSTWKEFPLGSHPLMYISVRGLVDWVRDAAGSSLGFNSQELSRSTNRIPVIAMTINRSPKYTRSFSLMVFIEK